MTAAAAGATAGRASANGAVALLLVIYTLNYLDRQIVNIVAEPIKTELGLLDWQLGLLTGLAFAVFYTVLGIPLARHADRARTDRPVLIAACLGVWSAMTALCGLATTYVQLLLARIGVGVGEAGCSPAAHSLISDIVPRERRASAMAIYSMGIPLGKLFGLLIGGVIAQALGWRMSFLLLGVPGVLLALVTWKLLPEPRRRRPVPAAPPVHTSIMASLRQLTPIPTFWTITFGGAFMSFLSYGQTAFLGSFFIRAHGVNVGEAGVMLGLALGGAGAIGTWLGGRIADRWSRRDRRAYVLAPAVASGLGALLFVTAILSRDLWPALAILAAATALTSVWYGPVFATVQSLVEPDQRAMAAAVHLFFVNLIGLGLGPLTFGILSDLLNSSGLGPAEGLRYALLAGSATTVVAIGFFLVASRTIRADLK
ncbi:spinster family MFS transporter [Phenylobacterium sp.]|uniref:spinster family MFS transporter n=1 Tax=Phenylobacterium sp. TaxID=1871053 RepID=UPI002FE31959